MKNYQTYNRRSNFQTFRRHGVVPGDYDKNVAWFEQHPFYYYKVAMRLLVAIILIPVFVWGLGGAIDWQIDETNRRNCTAAYHNESISHPLVQDCLKYYETGNIEYMRDL